MSETRTGWQPIETAPRDGTKVDLWLNIYPSPRSFGMGDSFRVIDCWFDGEQWVHIHHGAVAELFKDYVTHWMPLPSPPEAALEAAGLRIMDAGEGGVMAEPTGTVADIPDEELLRRAVMTARMRDARRGFKHPRWTAVMDTFLLGSTYATQLCARFGFDPSEMVKR